MTEQVETHAKIVWPLRKQRFEGRLLVEERPLEDFPVFEQARKVFRFYRAECE
jgi:hypothetical protein